MVLGKTITKIVEIGATYGSRIARSDKVAWNKLYSGFPRYVKKGTREGFLIGSSVGGLIQGATDLNPDGTNNDNGFQKKKQRFKTRKQSQAYHRRRRYTPRDRCPKPKSYWR